MKLKTVEIEGTTYAEINDEGKPVYVGDDGKEHAYDAPAMRGSLDRLNSALEDERKAKGTLETQLAAFEGIEADKAREALKKVQALKDKDLIDAGEAERLRTEIKESFQGKLDAKDAELETVRGNWSKEKLSNAFNGSKFVKDKIAIPPDMLQATFGQHFEVEDGKIKPVDGNGNTIFSKSNPGEIAGFDDALEQIIAVYPHRDSILKGSGANGSGAGAPNGAAGKKSMTRADFDSLTPDQQHKAMTKDGVTLTD